MRRAAPVLARAGDLQARGRDAMGQGKPALAGRLLARGLQLVRTAEPTPEARDAETRLLITLANAEFELSGFAVAMRVLETAAAIGGSGRADIALALHGQRGLILARAGRVGAAVEELERAERFFAEVSALDRAIVLLNRGVACLREGRVARARADLERCAAEAAAAGAGTLQVKAMHNLGLVSFVRGDLPAALHSLARAAEIDPSVSPGIALEGRARVLVEAGLTREADEALARAAEIFRRDRLTQDLAATELDRAKCALAAGDVAAARKFAARARDRWRRRGDDGWQRAAELVLLQGDLAANRPPRRLIDPALRAQRAFEDSGLRLQARLAARIAAEAQLRAGDLVAARAALATGRPRRDDPVSARLHHRLVAARLTLAEGHRAVAARRVGAGLAELARYQASFGSIDLSTAAAVHGRQLAELGVSIALSSGRPDKVFGAAEQARAVTNRLAPVRPPDDPDAADLLTELRRTIESLRAVEQDRDASAPLLRRRRELEQMIAARAWTRAGSGEAAAVASVEAIAETLGDAALLMLVQSGTTLHAVLVAGGRVTLHEVGTAQPLAELVRRVRADLDVLAQPQLPPPMRTAVHASYERSLGRLDGALLAPVPDGARLTVVSTGVFGQLPWGLLPSLRCRPVEVAPSATAWLAATRNPTELSRQARANGGASPGQLHERVACVSGPGLTRADEEAVGVAGAWASADVVRGKAATGAAVAKLMASASVVHIAAHGTHQTENPLFSSLRLADGPLFAHELDLAGRAPEHVVLSACELGLATVRPGDEALGLTSVLLHLGTRSVVAGVARVGDDVAADTMTAYHRELAAGADSATALASALAANDPDRPAPFGCFGASWRRGAAG